MALLDRPGVALRQSWAVKKEAIQTPGKRKTRVRRTSGLPTLFDEAVLDFDGPVFVGCLQQQLASKFRLGLVIFLTTSPGQPESPEPESYVSPT